MEVLRLWMEGAGHPQGFSRGLFHIMHTEQVTQAAHSAARLVLPEKRLHVKTLAFSGRFEETFCSNG